MQNKAKIFVLFTVFQVLVMAKVAIALATGFGCISSYLLRNPTVLHKKKNLKFRCTHVSHRGGAAENLENTMTAFKHAHNLGTEMLEIDCHITKDGVVVVSHDNILERTTGHRILITETNFDDLPQMKSTLEVTFCRNESITGTDRAIPKLKDVFEAFPNTVVNIDIKIDNDRLIHEVSELIRQYKREEITIWGNFSDKVTSKCYKENPNIHILISFRRLLIIVSLYYLWLLPFYPIKESALEVPMPTIYHNIGKKYFTSKMGKLFGQFLDYLIMDKKLIHHLNERGLFTALWVLNNESEFKRAYEVGIKGVMTDYPTMLRTFLNDNPQYVKQ